MVKLYMFRASLAHHQEFRKLDTWLHIQFPELDDERVTLETCRVLPSNKEHKKLHLIGTYMVIIKFFLSSMKRHTMKTYEDGVTVQCLTLTLDEDVW